MTKREYQAHTRFRAAECCAACLYLQIIPQKSRVFHLCAKMEMEIDTAKDSATTALIYTCDHFRRARKEGE